jgi:trk system potassium uptake protein TrkH
LATGLAVFHAVSAFCNAGFDLMGEKAAFSSMTSYRASVPVNVVLMLLIVLGGVDFQTLDDVRTNRRHLGRYRLQSKLALATLAVLLIAAAAVFRRRDRGSGFGRTVPVEIVHSAAPQPPALLLGG